MATELDNKGKPPVAGQADPNAQLPPEEDLDTLPEDLQPEPTGKPEAEEGKDKDWYPGKYKTSDEGLKGLKQQEAWGTQQAQERARLEQENAELKKYLAQPQQKPSGDATEKFKEYWGEQIEKDPIMAFAQMADEAARFRLQQVQTQTQAQQNVWEKRKQGARDSIKGYKEAEPELDKYYNTLDPAIQQAIYASPVGEQTLLNLYKGSGNHIPKPNSPSNVPYVEGSGRTSLDTSPEPSTELRRLAKNMGVKDDKLKESLKRVAAKQGGGTT